MISLLQEFLVSVRKQDGLKCLTFLKLTLKFDPLGTSYILSMNLLRVCMLLHLL